MLRNIIQGVLLVAFATLAATAGFATVPTIIHYQGVLTNSMGDPVTTATNVVFTIYDSPNLPTVVKWTETRNVTPDSEGRFAILLGQAMPLHDSVFSSNPLFLGIKVSTDPELTPRSVIASVPYAYRPATVDGASGGTITGEVEVLTDGSGPGVGIRDPGGNIGGYTPTSSVFTDNGGDTVAQFGQGGVQLIDPGTFDTIFNFNPTVRSLSVGSGSIAGGLQSLAVGTDDTASGDNSAAIGSTNRAIGPNSAAFGTGNTASGTNSMAIGAGNLASGNNSFAVGLGGVSSGQGASIAGGNLNLSSADATIVGGGFSNEATGANCTVAGGFDNLAGPLIEATVGGGAGNVAGGAGTTVCGGSSNDALGWYALVGGGWENFIHAGGTASVIGGGYADSVTNGEYNVIGGGYDNQVSGAYATVCGGTLNRAAGKSATVAGGEANSAADDYAFAAGRRAKANHEGAFVWGDATDADVTSSAINQFTARASGGVRFYSNAALTAGVTLAPGDGTWASVSDRNLKRNIEPVSCEEVLAKLVRIPITEWTYSSQEESIRHIGPMAQDFHAAFGLGTDDRHITTIDADGVALAAVQALYAQNLELRRLIESQQAQLNELKRMIKQ